MQRYPTPMPQPYGSPVTITNHQLVTDLGESALLGDWFAFLKPEWLARSGLDQFLNTSDTNQPVLPKPIIAFRGKEVSFPGAKLAAKTMSRPVLLTLTADKALYRANRDTVRLLIVAPRRPGEQLKLRLQLSGNPYAEYPLTLDETGCLLWSLQGLPEGQYEADIEDGERCRFEVAEYRLAPLNAELTSQRFSGQTLEYTLTITAFGQPYTGSVAVELQERGQRVGTRSTLNCNQDGQCSGNVQLSGAGPYTLNVFAGERTATVALKGSEQERRETTIISKLGEVHEISLLPLPESDECRSLYTVSNSQNNEPFLMQRVIGDEVELTARVAVELLRVVVVNPACETFIEYLYEQLEAGQQLRLPTPSPYGVVMLGAFIDGNAWEGGGAVLCPSHLQLQCEAPAQAKPGARLTIKLKTNVVGHKIPVQLIVKDQRLISPGDPQVELAASIKKDLDAWFKEFQTGKVEHQLSDSETPGGWYGGPGSVPFPPAMVMSAPSLPPSPVRGPSLGASLPRGVVRRNRNFSAPPETMAVTIAATAVAPPTPDASTSIAGLARVRMQFPEVVYNALLKVDGEVSVEVKLGESMTRYAIEVFALDPETLDWRRVETSVEVIQPVYGELTVSPFVFPGDPVMGRLDVGAVSGKALVEVRLDGEMVPLCTEDGNPITPADPVPSGSVLRFPVKPGQITALVRDASSDEADVSERFITEPGKLRHILRRLRLLTPGEEIVLQQDLAIKPMPGLEQSFQVFVEGAAKYPFGCVHQTSCKLLAMYTGYLTNLEKPEAAREYLEVIPIWYKRLKSMYLPQSGFCMYPPDEGGKHSPDTYYAPKAIKLLLMLPASTGMSIQEPALREMLDDIAVMVKDGAEYYKIEPAPKKIASCHDAYQVWLHSENQQVQRQALAFVRSRLSEHHGQTLVEDATAGSAGYKLWDRPVAQREETAYAAATLLAGGERSDLPTAIAATNYLTGQANEEGRLYSTIDSAANLSLLLALRTAGIITTGESGRVMVNGQSMSLSDALNFREKISSVRALEGVIAVEVTSEIIEDWKAFKNTIPVEIRLERHGRVQKQYRVGDDLDLIIRVPEYEPGMLVHVCLPEALARVVGGGQVKRFSLDFQEKNELRVPLAVVSSTNLPGSKSENPLWKWLGLAEKKSTEQSVQHWAVLVRNMFKEEQAGNPGLLEIRVE